MAMKRRVYGEQFKRDSVDLVTEQGYGISEAARNLGINAHMLGRWKCQVQSPSPETGTSRDESSPEQVELKRLHKEIQRLRMEREILKKRWSSLRTSRIEIRLYRGTSADLARCRSV